MNAALPWIVAAAAATVVLLAILLIRGFFLGYPPRSVPTGKLTRKEQAVIAACADAYFPAGGPIPISGTEAGLVAYMESYMDRLPSTTRFLSRALLLIVEHGPLFFGPRFARFTRLSPEERIASLKGMGESSIYFRRICFTSMRAMLTMGYLANPTVCRQMGMTFDPKPFGRHSSQGAFA